MTHLILSWWPKSHSASGEADVNGSSTNSSSSGQNASTCNCLSKMIRRIKKSSKLLHLASSRQTSSFKCRYDPLSYSLNFDTSGSGDEDYDKFCAFSSRFVATGSDCQRQRVLVAASH